MTKFVVTSPRRHGDPMQNDLPGLKEAKTLGQAACQGTKSEETRSYFNSQFQHNNRCLMLDDNQGSSRSSAQELALLPGHL
jgi:hypothetical protein